MSFLRKLDRIITQWEEWVLSYSIIVMALVLVGNVISRSLFNRSWTFAEEAGQFLVVAITFIGISYGARKGRHISMTAVIDLSPHKVQKALVILISSITSLTLFYLAYLGVDYTLNMQMMGRVTPALRVPMYLVVMFIPIGFILGGIQYLRNLIINIKEKDVYIGTEKPMNPEEINSDASGDYKVS